MIKMVWKYVELRDIDLFICDYNKYLLFQRRTISNCGFRLNGFNINTAKESGK